MLPSSKKKRLCRVNRLISVDRGILESIDSTGKLDGWEEILSPMTPLLDKSEGAVMMVSEEKRVDADGDSGPVIGMVWRFWSMSGPGCAYGHILPVLQMEGLLVDILHEQDQRLYDRLRTAHEYQFPAMGIEISSWETHCGHAHRSTAAAKAADGNTGITIGHRSSLSIHEWLRGAFMSRNFQGKRTWWGRSQVVVKGQPANLTNKTACLHVKAAALAARNWHSRHQMRIQKLELNEVGNGSLKLIETQSLLRTHLRVI